MCDEVHDALNSGQLKRVLRVAVASVSIAVAIFSESVILCVINLNIRLLQQRVA